MMSVRMPRRHRQSNLCECLGEIGVDVVSTVAEDQTRQMKRVLTYTRGCATIQMPESTTIHPSCSIIFQIMCFDVM